MSNNTNYFDDVSLSPGCYSFIIEDTDEDGFDFWANSDGVGVCQLKDIDGNLLKKFDGDFGKSIIFNFTVDYPLAYQQINKLKDESISIYPNPTNNQFFINWNNNVIKEVKIFNSIGQQVMMPINYHQKQINVNCLGYNKGIYVIEVISENGKSSFQKIVVE
jgi:hypothetical protein